MRPMKTRLRGLVASCFFGLLMVGAIGCNYSRYSVVIHNDTEGELSGVEISWGRHSSKPNYISPGSSKRHAFPNASFPERATVKWRTPDGVLHEQRIEVRTKVGWHNRLSSSDLVFTIQEEGSVEVRFEDSNAN